MTGLCNHLDEYGHPDVTTWQYGLVKLDRHGKVLDHSIESYAIYGNCNRCDRILLPSDLVDLSYPIQPFYDLFVAGGPADYLLDGLWPQLSREDQQRVLQELVIRTTLTDIFQGVT